VLWRGLLWDSLAERNLFQILVKEAKDAGEEVLAVGGAGDAVLFAGVDLHVEIDS
jgi:hypothetical protein